ncbi:MAG TPA: hypothetical protein PK095_03230, partial [Myxococcota bacterium]|nr:hypothetical protein [Myxococcota bacterium]
LVNPTLTNPLTQPATCLPNADTRVSFDLTVMRRAEQGFFDIAVSFEDVFCSAKFDCCYDDNGDGCAPDGSEDIELLFDANGQRARTFVLGFACAAPVSSGEQAALYLDALQLDCDVNSDDTTFVADLTLDPTQKGNLCVAGEVDTCLPITAASGVDANDYLYQAATYQTYELSAAAQPWETVSWNVALGVNPAIANCRLRTRGTYDDAANPNDHADGGRIRPGAIYPYIQWDVALDTCGSEPLTFAPTGPVTTRYTAPDQSLAFGYQFGEGQAASPFCEPACLNGGACLDGACDCAGTGFTGATCDEPICGPGLVYENGGCISPDTTPPDAIVLTAPSPNPFASGADSVTIAGSCESGATILVTGDETLQLLCENGTFSLDIPRNTNGTFTFDLAQRDDANNTSAAVSVQWTRDDVVPAPVTLSSPTPNPLSTNGNAITITGTCAGANSVELSGPTTATTTCNSMSFSFDVSSPVDGTFVYTVRQVGALNGFVSDPVTVTWTRDTLTPGAPTITQPSTNPYASGDTEFVLSGDCEAGTAVHLTGDTIGTTTCAGDGTFAFSISSSVDGTFEYAIHQSDAAQNSSASIGFEWLRDTNIPASPTIDDPGTSPFYSASTPLQIAGTCTTGYTVFLQGASTQSETCVGSSYAFSDPKSIDGAYAYSVYQQNPNNLSESTVTTLVWNLDRVAPDEVTVTSPAANPYFSGDDTITIAGACEPGSIVDVTGSETLTLPCPAGTYTFQVTRLSNATYNFNIVQTDKAGNTSLNYLFQWVRDATIPATPVIVSPASSPYYSSASSLVISGTCQTGYRVDLTGASTQNMTCASSAFSFTVPGSTDATRTYAVKQTNTLTSLASSETSLTWVRDATAPALVTITQPSTNPYTSGDTLFALNGTCETNTTVTLSGAQNNSQTCSGGTFTFNLSKSTDGTYNYTL